MIKTAAITGIVLALALGALLILAALKPDVFRVQRSVSIKAAPEKIFPLINEFDRWSAWSPYEKKDPAMKRTRSGPAAGKGAAYAWEGNGDVGAGRMEITDSSTPSLIALNLDFTKPFEAHNKVEFTLEGKGGTTNVTWSMRGPVPYVAKIVHVIFDMDKMVGKDFEAGLANLKSISES
jgi:uncharacterized protein YndB with AHSA1/START domain